HSCRMVVTARPAVRCTTALTMANCQVRHHSRLHQTAAAPCSTRASEGHAATCWSDLSSDYSTRRPRTAARPNSNAMMDLDDAPAAWLGELQSWAPQGIAKRIDLASFVAAAMATNLPPWRPIPSRSAARMLGTSLQSLANWRMRDLGPKPEPMKKGRGNRVF